MHDFSPPVTARSSDYWFLSTVAVTILIKLWFIEPQLLVARGEYPHDDTLFLVNAFSILKGEWLGEYHQYTLIKGPLYPLWIAFSHYTGLSLRVTGELLYALATFTFIVSLWYFNIRRKWLYLAFVFIYFNPVSYHVSVAYAFRLSIYFSLALFTFGALLGLATRTLSNARYAMLWSILLGFVFTAFWHTREEGLWIVPSLLIVLTVSLIIVYSRCGWGKNLGKVFLLASVLPGAIFLSLTSVLVSLNKHYYDIPHTVEIKTKEFAGAYDALLSVEHRDWKRFYPVPKETLERVYEISDKAKELRPYLEPTGWSKGEDDIRANFFIWSLRDAVAAAGYYAEGGKAVLQYYDDLRKEIKDACSRKKLTCNRLFLSGVPPWRSEYNDLILPELRYTIKLIFKYGWFKAYPISYSTGDHNFRQTVSLINNREVLVKNKAGSDLAFNQKLRQFKKDFLNNVFWLYKKSIPLLFIVSLLLLPILTFFNLHNRRQLVLLTFGYSVLVGILMLTTILTLLRIIFYPSIDRAMYTTQPLLTLFITVVIVVLGLNLSTWKNRKSVGRDAS